MPLSDYMEVDNIIRLLRKKYSGLNQIDTWGETSLFYNPTNLLKHGAYFLTFKRKDGENDSSSKLDRDIVKYRMNFKIAKKTFLKKFGEPRLPKRPNKGGVTTMESEKTYDPTVIDKIFPHPVYAWMSWVSVINPSQETIAQLIGSGFIDEAYDDAVERYHKTSKKRQYHD